jgi:uncharacterized protein
MSTIAILGAGADRRKFGNKCVRAFQSLGHTVFPVHPKDETVEGLPVYKSILDIPAGPIDRVSVYLPEVVGVKAMEEIAQRGNVGEVWLNPGADKPAVVEKAQLLGLKVIAACSIVAFGLSPSQFPDE